nr:glycosyltransferase [uncultured Eisenbergiella sp.]
MKNNIEDMNILHISIDAAFMDDSGYQETLLAKYHNTLCNKVTIVATNLVLEKTGKITLCGEKTYYNKDGVKIIRLRCFNKEGHRIIQFRNIYKILFYEKIAFIMIHSILSFDIWAAVIYKYHVNPKCVIVADSHCTKENHNPYTIKDIIFRALLIPSNRLFSRWCTTVYGVSPETIDFMKKYLGIPSCKIDLLGLGYDGSLIEKKNKSEIRRVIREKNKIATGSYVIIHGGKINEGKKTLELVKSTQYLPDDIVLIIFGDYADNSYKDAVMKEIEYSTHQILHVGFLEQKEIYDYYLASDLAVFPGSASVLRQQAVAAGLPIIVCLDADEDNINLQINDNAICLRPNWKIERLSEAILKIYKDSAYQYRAEEVSRNEYRKYSYEEQAKAIIDKNIKKNRGDK